MEPLVKDAVRLGLLNGEYQREDLTQFLGIMQRFAELLPQEPGTEKIGKAVVRIIIEETNFENCSLIIWNHKTEKLSLLAAFGLQDLIQDKVDRQYNETLSFLPGEGIAGQVFASREPVFIENAEPGSIPQRSSAIVQPSCLACLPLMDVGVLNISSHRPGRFSPLLKRNWGALSKFIGYLILQTYLTEQFSSPNKEVPSSNLDLKASLDAIGNAELSPSIIDRIPQGICILDKDGKVLRINEGIRKLQGDQASEVVGRPPSVFFRDSKVFQYILEKLSISDQIEVPEVSMVGANGELYLADVYATKLTDQTGLLVGHLLVLNDMTKKKALAEKMIRKEKLASLGTMAGGVAHDFNNLLMAILGNIQMILHQTADEETKRRLINIEKAVHDGANTVRRLQKFTGHEQEQQAATTDVSEAIEDVIDLTRPRWKNSMEKHGGVLDLQTELEKNCLADIHPSDLREVLTNLIFNAVEAMPTGGTLKLSNRKSNGWVVIEVADTGIGINEEILERIFDPFYTTKGVLNSGLGLSVSWSLVNRCGGELLVNSKQGQGSVFTIRLPGTGVLEESSYQDNSTRRLDNYRLLVVDDDVQVLEIVTDMLRFKGHEVVAVSDGKVALDLIENDHFDLVLTDLGMPGLSGWKIAEKVKDIRPDVPVILFTGWGAQYEEHDLTQRGVAAVLSKPLSLEKLITVIDRTIASRNRIH
ncbi:MAG: ATP-binding protein [Desulfoferrobacter sp.]